MKLTVNIMYNIGDIVKAKDIGYTGRALFQYRTCPDCGKLKWEYLHQENRRCWDCAAKHREAIKIPVTYFGEGNPKESDIALAGTLGFKGRAKYTYYPCVNCGELRWVRLSAKYNLCTQCTAIGIHVAEKSGRWKGGIKKTRGYVYVPISKDDPMYVMVVGKNRNRGIIAEHRLVAARELGRPLEDDEVVHHINGIKYDNRPSNLRVLHYHKHHSKLVVQELQEQLRILQARVTLLEAENVRLSSILSGVRDSDNFDNLSLDHYNTPDWMINPEGIVHPFSNGGINKRGSV